MEVSANPVNTDSPAEALCGVVQLTEEKIFGFEIPVYNHMTMTIVDSRDDLLEKSASLALFEFAVFHDVVEELSSGNVLHNHEDIGRRRNNLIARNEERHAKQRTWVPFMTDNTLYRQWGLTVL